MNARDHEQDKDADEVKPAVGSLGETNADLKATKANTESQRSNSSSSLIGTRLGDYQVMRKLGRGGMADVYAARQLSLGRDVALKVLRSDYARDKDYVQRFRREARAAAKLNHPNIVQVYDVGSIDSFHYISQELIDGENLRQSLDRHGVIGLEDAVEILVGVAAALEIAAEAGITHRDIKPENVMRSERGIIKVADFGLARLGADMDATQSNLTQAGLTLGTPRYMSPEQVQGKSVDVRSDLYSLGVTMYHLLSGRPPFEADDPLALALMHLHETPKPLDRARDRQVASGDPDLPEWLIAVVSRLMNKLPQDRFQSPTELLDAVRNEASTSNLGGFGVGTAAATIRLQRAADQARRLRWRKYSQLTCAILLPILCAVAAWGYTTKKRRRTVSELLSPEVVTEAGTVEEQYLMAMLRDDEAAWRSVSEYFPAEDNAANSAYQAKATLQLARQYADEGRLREADGMLDRLLQQASVDRVFQVLALAQRCQLLAELGRAEQLSDVKRELKTAYGEVKSNNPSGGRLVDQIVSPDVRLMLGIEDS